MASNNVVHVRAVGEEIQRICETELKTTLNLKSVILGDISFLPGPVITNMVNGIFIAPSPATTNEPDELPRVLMQKYSFRVVYIRRMAAGENAIKKSMEDASLLANTLTDKIFMPDITNMPATGQVLWMLWKSIEWHPAEDDLVSRIAADFTAVAINLEVVVRTKRAA